METSTSPMPKDLASRLSPNTETSSPGARFLNLPLEVRLLIYDKLLVQSDSLIRTFCTCKFCANLKSPSIGRESLSPSLLRTNKAINNEALPILYAKNIFAFFCYGPFAFTSQLNVSRVRSDRLGTVQRADIDELTFGPVANRHHAWAGVAKIIKCPSDRAKLHIRRISFKLDFIFQRVLDNFPNQWWQPVESEVLRFYPNLEHIELQILLSQMRTPVFHLVLQRKDLMAGHEQDRKTVMVHSRVAAGDGLSGMEAVCDAVIASQTQGEMKNCKFGVKTISWTDDIDASHKFLKVEYGTKHL